jgi:hypothetical protein
MTNGNHVSNDLMTKTRTISAVVLAGLLFAATGVYYFSGWSRVNCWTREIDINSGQTRYTRYWFWMVTKQEISPTWMSELLSEADENSTANWNLVVTLSPGTHHSPHYLFHGAIGELDTAQKVFEIYDIPRERRFLLAKAVRDSWNRTGRYGEAGELISQLFEEALGGKYPEK